MGRPGVLLLVGILVVSACGQPEPTPLQVGTHNITVRVPDGWEHVDYGDKHQFRQEMERISLEDLGNLGTYLDAGIKHALRRLREEERREVALRDTLEITGREARLIDTWDTISHQNPKRFLFVKNRESLLVLYTLGGHFEAMAPVFDKLATSLAYVDSVQQTGQTGGQDPAQ